MAGQRAPKRKAECGPQTDAWHVPRILGVDPTGPRVSARVGEAVALRLELEPCQRLPARQEWRRLPGPILSAATTRQDWCRVILYMPCVVRADGLFRMWYVGSSDHARSPSYIHLGYAESTDGLRWQEHPHNPLVTDDAIPWGHRFQAPYVLYGPAGPALQDVVHGPWTRPTLKAPRT